MDNPIITVLLIVISRKSCFLNVFRMSFLNVFFALSCLLPLLLLPFIFTYFWKKNVTASFDTVDHISLKLCLFLQFIVFNVQEVYYVRNIVFKIIRNRAKFGGLPERCHVDEGYQFLEVPVTPKIKESLNTRITFLHTTILTRRFFTWHLNSPA